MKALYKQIIIGATFKGCGLAAVSPGSLVVEPSNHVGADFVFTFNPGHHWETPNLHPLAEKFKNMLICENVLREDRLHCGALASVFAHWCLQRDLDIELHSDVISINAHDVVVINGAGKSIYTAEKVVDARPQRLGSKFLTALVNHPELEIEKQIYDNFSIIPGPFRDESYVMMEVPVGMNWVNARCKFHRSWLNRPTNLAEWKLVLIGSRFDYGQYANPLIALNAGLHGKLS